MRITNDDRPFNAGDQVRMPWETYASRIVSWNPSRGTVRIMDNAHRVRDISWPLAHLMINVS